MYYKRFLVALLLSSGILDVTLAQRNRNNNNNNNNDNDNDNGNNGNDSDLQLDPNNVQKGSQSDGLDGSEDAGTAASDTYAYLLSGVMDV